MEATVKIGIALVALYLLANAGKQAKTTATTTTDSSATDFERPQWGANWISNQWAMLMEGELASSGQIKSRGYL